MADGHLGYIMPIGGVAAYAIRSRSSASVSTSPAATRRSGPTSRWRGAPGLATPARQWPTRFRTTISFGIGRKNAPDDAPVDHPLFESRRGTRCRATRATAPARQGARAARHGRQRQPLRRCLRRRADAIWVGVHFGSRGFGHTIASGFLALSQGEEWGTRVPEREVLLALDSRWAHDYWELMKLAGEYAYAGREWVARKVVAILGGRELELVHNHHNFAWREQHDGETVDRGAQGRDAGVSRARRDSSAARWATTP